MVKRKAEVSLEEWLREGPSSPETGPTATVAAEGTPSASNNPTVEANRPIPTPEVPTEPVPAGPVTAPAAERGVSVEDKDHWFWVLLEESGYERW